jgi:hypothetical protein
VVEFDLSEVLARYLAHIFNIVLKTALFQHSAGFCPVHDQLGGPQTVD